MKHWSGIVTAALVVASGSAGAQTFNQFIGFGDSTIDSGAYRVLASPGGGAAFNALWPSAVAAGAGKPTTSPGAMNSEALAALFGLTAKPFNQGGSNYATSGAKNVTVNSAATGGFTAAIPTVTQIANYLAATGGHANGDAIYSISSGGNDVSFALGNSGPGPALSDPTAYVVSAANSLVAAIVRLQAAGARYIVVAGQPYSFPLGNGGDNPATRSERLTYTRTLWSGLASAGVNFVPADINAARLAIAANPASFGFQFIDNAGGVACTKPAGVTTAWALLCSSNPAAPSHLVTPNADQTRLFADDQHLTTAGQKILADYQYSLIVAPSEISFLAEAPVKTRAALVDTIFNQIAISQRGRMVGSFNAWISGDVSSLKMNSGYTGFPNDPGVPVAGTVGVDYAFASGWLLGGAVSVGTTKQSFDLGGNFKQNEFAGSLYAAYSNGPVWLNLIGSYGGLRYDVNRTVPIGITLQPNTGSTNGNNASFAAEVGYNFTTVFGNASVAPPMPVKAAPPAPVTPAYSFSHGPVAGIVLQRVRVDGFTETDAFASIGGFTALSFADQTRNSAVSELGYQASVDFGIWHPFAKLVWNHEFVSTDRSVTAYLTSATFAPSYWMPAVVFGRDWATGTIGTTATVGRGITAYATFSGQMGQTNVVNYGGQLGFNVAFGPAPEVASAKY
jgi:outer membrane lipase/esterase